MTALSALFGASLAAGLAGAVMPGPLFAATLEQSLDRGPSAGPWLVAGHLALELVVVAVLVLGAGAWLVEPRVAVWVGILGGAVLTFLGVQSLATRAAAFRPADGPGARRAGVPRVPIYRLAGLGVALSLANPYFYAWWGTVGLMLVTESVHLGKAGLPVMFSAHALADLGWFGFVALLAGRGGRGLAARTHRVLARVCGGMILALGVAFLLAGIRGLA
jgi:threonine/homoserine/homoserine lactone efflux protein